MVMKHNIKYVISLVFMFLLTQGAWADPAVTIIKQLNGSPAATASPGEVTSEIANGKCTLTVTPAEGNYVTKDFITVYSVVTGNVAQGPRRTPDLDNTPIAVSNKGENTDPTGTTTYEFTMPTDGSDAEVTVNFHSITTYNLFIGETQVTVLNAADVLGNGKVSFTSVLNNQVITNTLTLNGATLTVPVKVGLDNLTIDIQGENSITTTEACIQKMDNTSPSLIFRSNSDEVGSLTLKGSSGVYGVGYGTFSISDQFAVILKKDGLYYSDQYFMTDGSTKEVILAPSYGLTVGGMQIYEGNATDVKGYGIGDGQQGGMVSFNKATSTLTLKNANLSGIIRSSLPNLIIELVGNSSISSGGDRTIQAGSAVNMTIQSTAGNGSLSMHKSYSSSELGNFVDGNVNLTIATPLSVISGSLTSDATENDYYATIGVSYGLTVNGVDVTSANATNVLNGDYDGQVSYDAKNNVLTLNSADLYGEGKNIVYSGTADLTIALNGSSYVNSINYGGQGAAVPALTFTKVEGALPGTTMRTPSDFRTKFSTVNYEDWLGLYVDDSYVNDVFYDVMSKTPTISSNWNGTTNKREVTIESKFDGTVKYSLTYADENLAENNKTNETITKDDKIEMLGPATITATITIGSETSPEETAYYFGVMPNPLKFEYDGGDTKPAFAATLYPSVEGVSFTPYSSPGSFATFSEEGEVTINGFGSGLAYASLNLPEERTFSVITDSIGFRMEVLPVKPTITKSDKITLSVPETLGGDNTSIYYKWEGDDAYTQYTEPFDVEVGTLYAQTRVSVASTVYASEDATAEYLKDIAKATVVGLENPATATYTGAAITPSFTVKASAEAEDNLVEGTDYTVRYEKVEGVQQPQEIQQPQAPRRAPEESESVTIKDAGGYIIIIEGKGNYGGTKTVGFTVNQASLANVTIAEIDAVTYTGADLTPTLTVTFGENAVDETEYTVKYEKGTAEVEAVVEPGQYDVTLTSTNKNFAANSTKSAKFNILPVAPTIAYNSEVTYLDTDEIEITAADGMKIFYTWETGDIFGSNEYNVTQDALMEYGTNTMPVATNGTLRAWAGYLLEDNIYLMSAEVTQAFTVKKDINNAAIYISAASATYTGAAITPEFTLKESEEEGAATISTDNYTVRYEKADDKPQAPRRAPEESESVTIKDAGDYLIIIEGKNEYGGTKNIPFEITQAENSLTTTPAAVAELIYTGDALELVTAGVAKFGDLLYKLGADGTYSATIPTATDANTTGYTVYYKVEGNDNYTGIEETSVVVTIDKATATITKAPAAKTLTYTGEALELVEAGTVSAGTMVYSMTIDGTFAEAIPTATNAGSYTVYYKVNGDDNYTGIEASETNKVTVTIGQAEITSVELVEATLPYSGEAQTPTIAKVMAGDIEVGAGYYEITGGNAKTAVGEYELTVAAKTMEGNNFKGSAKVAWSIVNRTLTVGEDVQFADGQKWASFYTPSEDLELPEGVMAYIVTGVNESEKSVTVKAVNKVLKSVPMLLENNSTETTTNVSAEGNLLQVATEATAVSSINGTVYGLYNNAMMRVTTGTIALGKCYLVVNGKQNAPRLTITKDDQATGIESLTPALSEGEGAWYTIDGKKLQQKPTKKGIYIVNGKKMVVNNK